VRADTANQILCPAWSIPGCARYRVQREFKIPSAVHFGIRQATTGDVHLQRMQNELWHRQYPVAGVAQSYELSLVLVCQMRVRSLLFCYSALPAWLTTSGLIIVSGEKACLVGKTENSLNRFPQN